MVKGGKVLFWVILAAALGFCIGLAGRFGMKLRDAKTAVIRVGLLIISFQQPIP